jgi:hypothetical protein
MSSVNNRSRLGSKANRLLPKYTKTRQRVVIERTARATGVCLKTVYRIRKEQKEDHRNLHSGLREEIISL